MALLDELFIRIVADSSGVDRAVDESTRKTDKLTDSLDKAETQSHSTGEAFAGFAAKALGALTAALSVGNTISGAIERASQIGELSRTSEALNIAIEDLDAFGKAAERAGGDAQGARDSLTDMAEALGEALSGKESGRAKAFQALGLTITDVNGKAKDGLTGILDLASAVENLDKSTAVFKIKELGITDNRTVEMVLKGRKELERMLAVQKEQGVVTKESAERALAFNSALAGLRGAASNTSNAFLDSIIPALTKVVEWLTKVVEWAGEHKDFIVGFFVAIAGVVAGVYLPAMIAAATATIAATWPLIAMGVAIAAAAAAFALIYEDVMNFIDGNDSLIGQIFEKYPLVEQVVMSLANIFRDTFQTIMTGASQAGDFISIAFSQIVQAIKFCIDYLVEAYGSVSAFVSGSMGSFEGLREGVKSIFAVIVATIRGALSSVTGAIDSIGSAIKSAAGVVGIKIGVDEPAPQRPRVMPSGSGQAPSDVPMVESSPTRPAQGQTNYHAAAHPETPRLLMLPVQMTAPQQAQPSPAQTMAAMESGNRQVAAAQSSPLNAVTSSAISNTTNRTSETSVNVERVEVNTQATDAPAISRDIGSSLSDQLRNLNHESATGVER